MDQSSFQVLTLAARGRKELVLPNCLALKEIPRTRSHRTPGVLVSDKAEKWHQVTGSHDVRLPPAWAL